MHVSDARWTWKENCTAPRGLAYVKPWRTWLMEHLLLKINIIYFKSHKNIFLKHANDTFHSFLKGSDLFHVTFGLEESKK